MLNLRQLSQPGGDATSAAEHFSRFSVNFRVPSDFLGNIGEPLDHSNWRSEPTLSTDSNDTRWEHGSQFGLDELRDQLPADRGMKASKWEILSKGASCPHMNPPLVEPFPTRRAPRQPSTSLSPSSRHIRT